MRMNYDTAEPEGKHRALGVPPNFACVTTLFSRLKRRPVVNTGPMAYLATNSGSFLILASKALFPSFLLAIALNAALSNKNKKLDWGWRTSRF